MMRIWRDYPVASILLLLLACIRFEYREEDWELIAPGLPAGLMVLGIVGIVLLFRIFHAVQEACIARGLLRDRIRCRYDVLIPIAIVATGIHGRWVGALIQNQHGNPAARWVFAWSDPTLAVPFIAAVTGTVFLIRILYLLRAIAEAPRAGN